MKKILILQNEIANYRLGLYRKLAERYSVTIIHSGAPAKDNVCNYIEIRVPSLKIWKFHFQALRPIAKSIRECDAVIAMFDLGWPCYIIPLLISSRPKYLLWGHRYSTNCAASILRNWLMRRSDGLILYGDEEISRILRAGVPRSKISIAWNTIDVPNSADFSGADKSSFIFVGRLQRRKRVDMLIRVFSKIAITNERPLSLDIVGDGEEEQSLRALAIEAGVADRIRFHGKIENAGSLRRLFSTAYAYVSPGAVGLGVLHSFAYGIPVVTTLGPRHGPEFHNLSDGLNSRICDDESSLLCAMRDLYNSESGARRMGANAFDHYTIHRSMQQMLNGFVEAIDS